MELSEFEKERDTSNRQMWQAIQRLREVTNQYIEHGDFVEKETALDILKALDGEQ